MSGQIVEGKKIASERIAHMRDFVRAQNISPRLVAITVDPNIPTQQFLKIKSRVAEESGIAMEVENLPRETTQEEVSRVLHHALAHADGVVLQLPFPAHLNIEALLASVPEDLDPDCIGATAGVLLLAHEHIIEPPVVSAIRVICEKYAVAVAGKKVAVVGQGRLVGAPASVWFEKEGAEVMRLTKSSDNLYESIAQADIVVLGAGSPGLLTSDMLREGVVIFDAGTSEEGGRVVGDADSVCAQRASLMTPVPGGIGPIAVAELFGNLLRLRFDYPLS